MTLNGVIALILLYFTELSGSFRGALRRSGWRCRGKKFTFAISCPDEFFWAIVCKMIRLCYRTIICLPVLSVLSVCLSVTLVYCGQTVWWIRMPLGAEVGIGTGHIVLDGTQLPPRKGPQQPLNVSAHFVLARSPISATAELLLYRSFCFFWFRAAD